MLRIPLNIQKFASGTVGLSVDGALEGRIVWSSSTNGSTAQQKAANNSSTVTGNLQIHRTTSPTTTGTFSFGFRVGSELKVEEWYGTIGTDWVTIKTITNSNVPHNADGSGSCLIEAYVNGPSGTSLAGRTTSGSSTVTLDKINRYAVTNSVTGSDIDGNFSVNYTKYINDYKYKLRVGFTDGGYLKRIDYNTSGESFAFTSEEIDTIYDKYPDTNNFQLTFAVETYNSAGSTVLSYGNYLYQNCTKQNRAIRLRINNEWKKGTPYVRANGEWKKATPHIRINNEWKRGK